MQDQTIDRLAIRELIERYSDAVTRRDWAATAAVFAEDAVWTVAPPINIELRGRAGITEGIRGQVDVFEVLVQMSHSIVIELNGDRAMARTIINEFARKRDRSAGAFMLGTYTDTVVRDGGGWLFESRLFEIIYLDSAVPAGMAFGSAMAG